MMRARSEVAAAAAALAREDFICTLPWAEGLSKDLRTLRPRTWLTDEVINLYAILILLRVKDAALSTISPDYIRF